MKLLFSTVIVAHRYFCTKTATKSTKWIRKKSKNKTNNPRYPRRAEIKWTEEQSRVLSAISSSKSVFITGSAGTGKTFLLQHIIKRLRKLHNRCGVFVTASTGVAACVLRGQTLHSFAGIGFANADRQTLLNRVLLDREAYRRWNRARALVIDEISLVDAEFFDNLDYIARKVRAEEHDSEDKVWGGIQLVVGGDFLQLPPIIDRKNARGKEFAFEADCWNSSFDLQVELTKIFRQSDPQLVKLLQNLRRGECDREDLQLLEKCCAETDPDSLAIQLYPRNDDVNRVNKNKIKNMNMLRYVYRAVDRGEDPWKRQLKQGIAPEELVLSVGARVMLIKNLNPWRKLVNGATGTVMEFCFPDKEGVSDICEGEAVPLVRFDSGEELIIYPETWVVMDGDNVVATRRQMPLMLAWALSVHKCQGMTLDGLQTDLSRAFGCGMVYVALSRITSLDGLRLSGFDPVKIKANPKVLQFYQQLASEHDKQEEKDGVDEDESSSTDNIVHEEMSTNSSLIFHCKPNSSLISWFEKVTRRG